MKLTKKLIERITIFAGKFNTDILLGWEDGLKGKQRIGGKLFHRNPPAHFSGERLDDWYKGYKAAKKYKESLRRCTIFFAKSQHGRMKIVRKGWIYQLGKVITQMEKAGAYGDVEVFYFENGEVKRIVKSGI